MAPIPLEIIIHFDFSIKKGPGSCTRYRASKTYPKAITEITGIAFQYSGPSNEKEPMDNFTKSPIQKYIKSQT